DRACRAMSAFARTTRPPLLKLRVLLVRNRSTRRVTSFDGLLWCCRHLVVRIQLWLARKTVRPRVPSWEPRPRGAFTDRVISGEPLEVGQPASRRNDRARLRQSPH